MMKKVLCLLLILTLFVCGCSAPTDEPVQIEYITDTMEVHFVDVGQADCNLILLPTGQTMLIDAGNNDDADFICNYLDNLGIEKIDYLIGTHPHEDHIGSLDVVINNYEIGNVYMPDSEADTKTYRDVVATLEYNQIDPVLTSAGLVFYDDGIIKAEAVAPVKAYEDINNSSIVVRLTYKDASFLFTGDAEAESEKDITADISADVLSVGHHGSSTSTCDDFLMRVDPMYAIISCGKGNDYGHPHYEVLEKLEEEDITIYRTDHDGTLICTTKGEKGDYLWNTVK